MGYTLDYWRTTSESAAEYTEDVRKKHRDDPFDRFLFHIKIDDFSGVTDKTMFFCVRYNTAGQDHWDSNGGQNFRVEFHNRAIANRRASDPPLMQPIRRSSEDDIEVKLETQNTTHALKSPRSLIFENIYDDHPASAPDDDDHGERVKTKSSRNRVGANDSFSNRYDFGASLTAAIAAANNMLQGSGDEITLKNKAKGTVEHVEHVKPYNPYFAVKPEHLDEDKETSDMKHSTSKSTTPASSGDVSPVPGISSRSADLTDQGRAYQTLLDNYCFFQPKTIKANSQASFPQKGHGVETRPNTFIASPYDTPPYSSSPPQQGSPLLCGKSSMSASPMNNFTYDIGSSGSNTPIRI